MRRPRSILRTRQSLSTLHAMLASPAARRRQKSDCDTPSNLTKRLGNWRSKMKI